jgi:hypothetical protein
MTDLDRKIVELKGWRIVTATEFGVMTGREIISDADVIIKDCAPSAICLGDECGIGGWSTSYAKAFELVDEVGEPLFFIERFGRLGAKTWKAYFSLAQKITYHGDDLKPRASSFNAPRDFIGEAKTAAEAICRAYIALKEWEEKK